MIAVAPANSTRDLRIYGATPILESPAISHTTLAKLKHSEEIDHVPFFLHPDAHGAARLALGGRPRLVRESNLQRRWGEAALPRPETRSDRSGQKIPARPLPPRRRRTRRQQCRPAGAW